MAVCLAALPRDSGGSLELGMPCVERGLFLVGARERQKPRLSEQLAKKRKADGRAWTTVVSLDLALLVLPSGRRIVSAKTVRQNQSRMPGQIGHHQLLTIRGCYDHVKSFKRLAHRLHGQRPGAVSLNILDCRNEASRSKGGGPVFRTLFGQMLIATAASQFIK